MTRADEQAVYRSPDAWTAGPQLVYDRLAEHAVEHLGTVKEQLVLDAGAGTGGASRTLLRRGAEVTACDLSPEMLGELRQQTGGRVPTIVADILDLPMAAATYDATIACFVVNHLDAPADGLRELRRVTRSGGPVVATTFGEDDHPIKPAVDAVLAKHGFVAPPWYVRIKELRAPLIGSAAALTRVGEAAGLSSVTVDSERVDLSDVPAAAAAAYRMGLSHIAPFMKQLDRGTAADVTAEVIEVVRGLPPLQLPMLVLRGTS